LLSKTANDLTALATSVLSLDATKCVVRNPTIAKISHRKFRIGVPATSELKLSSSGDAIIGRKEGERERERNENCQEHVRANRTMISFRIKPP